MHLRTDTNGEHRHRFRASTTPKESAWKASIWLVASKQKEDLFPLFLFCKFLMWEYTLSPYSPCQTYTWIRYFLKMSFEKVLHPWLGTLAMLWATQTASESLFPNLPVLCWNPASLGPTCFAFYLTSPVYPMLTSFWSVSLHWEHYLLTAVRTFS